MTKAAARAAAPTAGARVVSLLDPDIVLERAAKRFLAQPIDRCVKCHSTFIGHEPEQLLVEEFQGVTPPANAADMQRIRGQIAAVENRVRDKLKELSGGGPAPPSPARSAITDAEIAAFAMAASEDPEAKRMFCRE